MAADVLDLRVLGAVRFIDAITGAALSSDVPLAVSAPGVRWIRNRAGWYVIADAPQLGSHVARFEAPPATPPLGGAAIVLTVRDPAGRYLPRRATVPLPRDPDAADALTPGSLFQPHDVLLFASPSSAPPPGTATVRAAVVGMTGRPLANALVRVLRGDPAVRIGWGMTDARGEALIGAPRLPMLEPADDDDDDDDAVDGEVAAVLTNEVPVTFDVVWDPAAGAIPDPDDLEDRHVALHLRSVNGMVIPGGVRMLTI